MSIKIEASRFAALKVEDDDSVSAIKNKPKTLANNKNVKNKNNKNQIKKSSNQTDKSSTQKSVKSSNHSNLPAVDKANENIVMSSQKKISTMDDQWEQWKQMDEKFVEQEFREQMKRVMQESKKKDTGGQATTENNFTNKQNKIIVMKEESPLDILVNEQPNKSPATSSHPSTLSKKEKNNKKEVQKLEDELTHLSCEDQLEIKNQSILEIKNIIENIQLEVGDFKLKNQKLCQYLLQGESSNVSELEQEIGDIREKHKLQTQRLTQLSTDLEKERSRGHLLKSEFNKLKTRKETSTK